MEPLNTIAALITVINALTPFFRKARKSFPWSKKAPEGIIDRSQLSKGKRLPGEVFAAELLAEPVRIEPKQGEDFLRIVIDRRNVEQAVITNAGKKKLCESFIIPERDRLVTLDRSIHAFLCGSLSGKVEPLVLPPMPLRWGSGGIVSVEPGKTYYFVVTVVNELGESEESKELSYTAAADKIGLVYFKDLFDKSIQDHKSSTVETGVVTIAWPKVPNATSYNIYWNDSPGVTKHNGKKISNFKSPHTIKGLKRGTTYYFVITAANPFGESEEAEELSYTID